MVGGALPQPVRGFSRRKQNPDDWQGRGSGMRETADGKGGAPARLRTVTFDTGRHFSEEEKI